VQYRLTGTATIQPLYSHYTAAGRQAAEGPPTLNVDATFRDVDAT
jgi:hypothetical protein